MIRRLFDVLRGCGCRYKGLIRLEQECTPEFERKNET